LKLNQNKIILVSNARIVKEKEELEGIELKHTQIQKPDFGIEEIPTNAANEDNKDDDILQAEQSEYFVFFNRLFNSKKFLIVYIIIMILILIGISNFFLSFFYSEISKYYRLLIASIPAFIFFSLLEILILTPFLYLILLQLHLPPTNLTIRQ
jgi:hypothetical protein